MDNLHDDAKKGVITGAHGTPKYFTAEPYWLPPLPTLPQIYIDDVLSRAQDIFGYLPETRANRTPILDQVGLFQQSNFAKDAAAKFGFCGATILKFDPMTCLDWHRDTPRRCGLNFLINHVDGMSHTFIREQKSGWNYNMTEISYDIGTPILINTELEHTTYNFHPTKTRFVLTITFGRIATYDDVKKWLSEYKCTEY
jgi:hypothetical protein